MPGTLWTRFKKWLEPNNVGPENVKEETMAKKIIQFTTTDGFAPSRTAGSKLFGFKSPIPMNLPPNTKRQVKLGISADFPLLLVEPANLRKRGLQLELAVSTLDAGVEVAVTVFNFTGELQLIDAGDILVLGAPLSGNDFDT